MTVIGTALVLSLGWTPAAWAKLNGIASGGCVGCHKGAAPTVRITVDPMVPPTGGSSLVSVHISRTEGNCGGIYLTSNRKGTFSLAGGPVKLVSPTEVVHSSPATATGDEVVFTVRWTAPAQPGGVDFETWAVS